MLGEVEGPDSPSSSPDSLPGPLTVVTAEAAELLTDPLKQRYLEPFLARDCTVTQAAGELGVTPNSLLYRVRQLQAAGLLEVVREMPRAGRTLKVYRSVADAFYVPFALTQAETVEALFLKLDTPLQTLFYQNVAHVMAQVETEIGLTVWRADESDVRTRISGGPDTLFDPLHPGAPSVLPFWSPEVWLEPGDAKALLGELVDLIGRYHRRGGRQRYLLHLGLAPLKDG